MKYQIKINGKSLTKPLILRLKVGISSAAFWQKRISQLAANCEPNPELRISATVAVAK